MTLSGQYNVSNNVVIDGEWNISGDYDNLTVGGNYVADAGFGAWNVGANYSSGDASDGFDLEAGILVPFGNMYYRGDFTYFLDSGYDSVFENALGWTNGNIDVNASVTMYELDDTSVDIEFGYYLSLSFRIYSLIVRVLGATMVDIVLQIIAIEQGS
ncbi:hypothetical protein [Vibrio echinoideorum]|uniref:hypothetical protein n=1 Tax=Vibrio echinoideorum TaxID=2100116 RepID=UPI001FD8CF9A|nr:hypothetical protein [Vibrio echinoideorum]